MALADLPGFAVLYWTLDEASGTRADSVGSNDLSDNNTVGVATGKFGNAADFERNNSEYLNCSHDSALSPGDVDFTWRMWVQAESIPSFSTLTVLQKGIPNDAEYRLQYSASLSRFSFTVYYNNGANSDNVQASNHGAISTGAWVHLVAVHDATNNQLRVYVNNVGNVDSFSSGVHQDTGALGIGAAPGGTNAWDGLIDDVVLLVGHAMTAAEVAEDYNSGTGVAFADWGGGGGGANLPAIANYYRRMRVA